VFVLLLVFSTGCSSYQGLDPKFAIETKTRNRIAVQWCVVRKAPPEPEEKPVLGELVVANAKQALKDRGYVVQESMSGVDINEFTFGPDTRGDFPPPTEELMELHKKSYFNSDENKIPERAVAWPPASLSPTILGAIDAALFIVLDCNFESLAEKEKRRKENLIRVPLAIVLNPLLMASGGGGTVAIYRPTTSWIRCSAILVNAADGRILYRQHKFFGPTDARQPSDRFSAVEGLFDELPRGE
jgi:hypothetical protein